MLLHILTKIMIVLKTKKIKILKKIEEDDEKIEEEDSSKEEKR